MDVVLPLLNLIESDGTLYLKEYLMTAGHAQGLRVACSLNEEIFS